VNWVAGSRGSECSKYISEVSGPHSAVTVSPVNALDVVGTYKSHDHSRRTLPTSGQHSFDDDRRRSCGSRLSCILSDCENSAVTSECEATQHSSSSFTAFKSPPVPAVDKLRHSRSFRVSQYIHSHCTNMFFT